MSLVVRYKTWLATVPDKATQSRFDRSVADGIALEFPWVEPEFTYLLDYFYDVGPALHNTAGDAPLSCSEIVAWEHLTGVELHPWESKILRRLSIDYLGMASKASDTACPSPYQSEVALQVNRESVSRQISNAMKSYIMSRSK